jgi:hypothetical protein
VSRIRDSLDIEPNYSDEEGKRVAHTPPPITPTIMRKSENENEKNPLTEVGALSLQFWGKKIKSREYFPNILCHTYSQNSLSIRIQRLCKY